MKSKFASGRRQECGISPKVTQEVKRMSDKSRLGSGCRGPAMMNCQHGKLSADMLNDVDVQLQVRECFQPYSLGMMGNPSTASLLMSTWITCVVHVLKHYGCDEWLFSFSTDFFEFI